MRCAVGGGVGRCDGVAHQSAGELRLLESVITPTTDGLGSDLHIVIQDVSERRLGAQLALEARRTRALKVATGEIVWHADAAQANGSGAGFTEFAGLPAAPIWSRAEWLDRIHPEDRRRVDEASQAGVRSRTTYVVEYRLRRHDCTFRWVEDRAVPVTDAAGELVEWVGVTTDIDDRVRGDQALRDSEERLRLAVEAGEIGIWDVDMVRNTRRWSPHLKAMLGLPPETPESEELLLSLIRPEDRWAVEHAHRTGFRNTGTLCFRINRADNGAERWIQSSGQAVLDAEGNPIRRLGTFLDVTQRQAIEQQLWQAANQDALTGLANRAMFQDRLEEAIADAARDNSRVALMIVDLDRFKEVNDTLGHDAGDAVLRHVADCLARTCPAPITVARLGGDEFAVLVPQAGLPDEIGMMAAGLVQRLSQPFRHDALDITCPVSLGAALFPDHDPDSGELLKNADLALYAAKQKGRARAASFEPAMKTAMRHRVTVLQRARMALAEDRIVPFYQPKVAFGGGAPLGFEALLRWHGDEGVQGPGMLADALDDAELAPRIGQRMLDLVAQDLVRWRKAGLAIGSVALNVSAAEFSHADVAVRWLSTLQASRLPASALQMEVTETAFLGDGSSQEVARSLDLLHQHGISIALDDFGTGFASLTHLRQYPVDWLKIDQSFIRDLDSDRNAQAIVAAVIQLAHGIGLRVVAEGVETASQVDTLRRHDCDLLQGYLIARPMPASRVPHFLRSWSGLSPSTPRAAGSLPRRVSV